MIICIELKGGMVSGKNQQGTDPRTGHRFPNARFKRWREKMLPQVRAAKQAAGMGDRWFICPLAFWVEYWPADGIHRDMPGLMDALFHLMEQGRVVENDNQFEECRGWKKHPADRINPRLLITMEPAGAESGQAGTP